MTTPAQIEAWLLAQEGWVSVAALCARFGVDQRELREDYGQPGLLGDQVISHSRKGYRHLGCATRDEWLQYLHGGMRGSSRRIRKIRRQARLRRALLLPRTQPPTEADSGQVLLNLVA